MKQWISLLTVITMTFSFSNGVLAFEADTIGSEEEAIESGDILGQPIPLGNPAGPANSPLTTPDAPATAAAAQTTTKPDPQPSGEGFEEARFNTYAIPAFALGTIAVVAIIAVAVQNANSGHGHGHSH